MLEKELVLGDVGIGKVELNLEVNIVMNSIFRADIYVYKWMRNKKRSLALIQL